MTPFKGSMSHPESWRHFQLDLEGGVATLTFRRPSHLNALTFETYADLRDLFTHLAERGDIRAVVITGEGRGFCSGGDVEEIIGELQRFDARTLLEFTRMTGAVIGAMRNCPQPIIAAVNGTAAGAGAVIALAADFRILSAGAVFRFLFTRVGLSGADMGAAYLLPRLIGLSRATEMLMFGEPVDAPSALAAGLANRVVDAGELLPAAHGIASRVATGPSLAYSATKLNLTRELDMDLAGALEMEAMTQALLMTSRDHHEFYDAHREGRSPRWEGR